MVLVPVEVRCRAPPVQSLELCKVITSFIRQRYPVVRPGEVLFLDGASELLRNAVEQLRVCDVYCPHPFLATDHAEYVPLLYCAHHDDDGCDEPLDDEYDGHNNFQSNNNNNNMNNNNRNNFSYGDISGGDGAVLPACTTWPLPNASLEGLWESLHYGETAADSAQLKRELLQFIRTTVVFAAAAVNTHAVACNRLVLLHGPPGTGKTSLCRALANKLSIRLSDIFPTAQLVEINAHSLFSRWFSESGKQVMLLFRRIHEMAEDASSFLCVIVDEIESLAAARTAAMRGNEPSDAIRVVNALLTQLDVLQRRKNVIVLATSNITGAIDVAFVDRADKKVFIGPPGAQARAAMLYASLKEMMRCGLVRQENNTEAMQQKIEAIARRCEEFSGRVLKKLPLLAFSEHMGVGPLVSLDCAAFLGSLELAVENEINARIALTSSQ